MINKPVKTIRVEKPEIKSKKIEEVGIKHTSKFNTIIVSAVVTFIFGYIIFDFFVVKERIENKIMIVNEKFDSLLSVMRELTQEVKNLSKELSKKKDI